MARKIRFPLEMDNGTEVRSIQELRENFSVLKVLGYLKNGKLLTWLRDRYLNEEADAVQELDTEDSECPEKLCAIFDVPYDKSMEEELKEESCRQERISRLKQYTDKEEYEALIDQVAFDQDELYDLLDGGITEIYLCGERFSIPLSQPGVTYTGINKPEAVIDSKEEVDWKKKRVTVKNVTFDSKYQAVLEENRKKKMSADSSMACIEGKTLYKWNDEQERFEPFYEFQELDMYYRRIARDENKVYFMRQKKRYSGEYEMVSMDLADGSVNTLFDINSKEALDVLCIRGDNLFFRGQYPNRDKLLRKNVKNKETKLFILDKYTQDILIDKTGKNAYIRVKLGPISFDEIYRYDLEEMEQYPVAQLYNVHAMDLMNGYLLAWGKDTRKNALEEYYCFAYNTEKGKKGIIQGGSELITQALWRDEKKEYRLGTDAVHYPEEKYPLYRTDLPSGQTAVIGELCRPYENGHPLGKSIRFRKGYLYIMSAKDSIDGKGNGYEVSSIPEYRIRTSDGKVQIYNGSRYAADTHTSSVPKKSIFRRVNEITKNPKWVSI